MSMFRKTHPIPEMETLLQIMITFLYTTGIFNRGRQGALFIKQVQS